VSKPRVSVLMLTYNQERYIGQAIESALMQETSFDYEIVIGEDCSTDSTRKIVCDYAARNSSKIRLLLHPTNIGGFANLISTLSDCRGEYINILEGDDYWTSAHKLQKQVELLDRHSDCALCFHNAWRVFEGQNRVPLPYNSADQKTISGIEDLWQYDFIATCTAMFRKSCVRNLPKWYFGLKHGVDWTLWMLCAEHGNIRYIDEIMAVYRIHREGLWNQLSSIDKLKSLIALYQEVNANLELRYDAIARSRLAHWKNQLEIALKTNDLVNRHVPSGATMVVISRPDEDLPQFGARQIWPFPARTPRVTRQVFASGSTGSVEAPWIGKERYRFQVFRNGEPDRPLASVTVFQNSDANCECDSKTELPTNGAYIKATPNPVPKTSGFGKSVISWSTGDGSPGRVDVDVEGSPTYYPSNNAAAIEELESLHREGAEVLLVPHGAAGLFERYSELQDYIERKYRLIASDPDVASIYDFS